jgi:hypothetical protein
MAVQLSHRALATYWRILVEEPRRTGLTLGASYLLWILPQRLYSQMENVALKMTGDRQKRRIVQEQAR